MSSKIAIGLSLVTLLIGCAESDSTTPTGSDKKSGQPTTTNGNGESPLKPHSHVIAADTAYYTTGPQQGRPPDGTFKAGTQVNVLKNAGSYTLVRSADGIEAYVAEDVLKAADGQEDALVQGLRAPFSDISTSSEAISSDESAVEKEPEEDNEADDQ